MAEAVSIPVVGMGGIETGADALELLAAGATAVAVGTASFRDPLAGERVRSELERSSVERGLGWRLRAIPPDGRSPAPG